MGWDFSMEVDLGGPEPVDLGDEYEAGYTYNVSPMFFDAFGEDGIRGIDGLIGSEAQQRIESALEKMQGDPDRYIAMNPKNGWGNYDGAVELLCRLRGWCISAPKARMRVT